MNIGTSPDGELNLNIGIDKSSGLVYFAIADPSGHVYEMSLKPGYARTIGKAFNDSANLADAQLPDFNKELPPATHITNFFKKHFRSK